MPCLQVNLVALCVNLAVLPLVTGDPWLTGSLFLVLTLLHIYANYRAVSCLVMPTLNSARLSAVLAVLEGEGGVIGPVEGNRREGVLWPGRGLGVRLGVSLAEVQGGEVHLLEEALAGGREVLVLEGRVLCREGAQAREVYRGVLQALLGKTGGQWALGLCWNIVKTA